ncbi:hypothetical protein [Paraburkholderia tagetis]|uniref:Uncharacterized protein n=1 Tax=Paraburkholderia tagetis TaxID=2913261 RepID=A0A9X1UJ28_9BURK|nr:hypothetical protein [Paraburkholderia tagetis]MCG5076358.1 hypothetical protein [Paraburkholderia tagetis]
MKKAASTPVTRGRYAGDSVIGAFKAAIDAHGNRLKQLTDDANAQADEADRKASAGNVRVVA